MAREQKFYAWFHVSLLHTHVHTYPYALEAIAN